MARRRESSSESTSSRSSSGVEGRSPASASRSASSASRCSPCEPKPAQLAAVGCDLEIVEVRAEAGRPAREVGLEARLERRAVGASASYPSRPSGSPSSARRSRKPGDRAATRSPRRASTSAAPSSATRSVHGDDDLARRQAELDAPKAGVPLRERRRVLLRQAGLHRAASRREHPVDVGAANRGPTLDDSQPVGREHERRELAPQRLGRGKPRAVELRRLAALRGELHADLVTHTAAIEPSATRPPRSRRTGSGARRCAFAARTPGSPRCIASSRFVLPAPLSPGHEDDARLESRGRGARTSGSYEA